MLDKHLNIIQLEALNLVTALKYLAPMNLQYYAIVINTDNTVSQQILTSGLGSELVICVCACEIWLFATTRNTDMVIHHKSE